MARNNITCDPIANTKGSAEKYAEGWDRLFGKKAEGPTTVMALDFHDSQPAYKEVEVSCGDCGGVKLVLDDVLVWDCWRCGSQWPVGESVYD